MASRDERAQNRANAPGVLSNHRINFTVRNGGAHIVIEDAKTVDYWPGPQLWIWRGQPDHRRYGLESLLTFLDHS